MANFPITLSSNNKRNYKYNPMSPLVDNRGNPLRAYYDIEMTRVIEISESAHSPEKTNAKDIPAFLFFDTKKDKDNKDTQQPYPLELTIPENINKYYCRLQSYKEHKDSKGNLSGNHPDNPAALRNIISFHLDAALKELQEKNHPLPMTMVYQIGMNDNHTGTVAIRINSLTDPSKNEIMVINSLSGYSSWENAAIAGLSDALQHKATEANKGKSPQTIRITPETRSGISQADRTMCGSCSAITAAMSCAISSDPNLSFAAQEERLVNHMRTLCGRANEVALRRDHQQLLALPHPMDAQFNPEVAKNVLRQCQKHKNNIDMIINTAEEFVKAMASRELIQEAKSQLNTRGKTLYDICSAVSNPEAVKDMFMNIELMNAIEKEGNKAKLVQKHQQIYASMWPDYSRASSRGVNETIINTPEEFVRTLTSRELIQEAKSKLNTRGKTLYDMCSAVSNPGAVKDMFMNIFLMEAIEKEGNKDKLIQKHKQIYDTMWPDYSRASSHGVNETIINTPEEFVRALTSRDLIQEAKSKLNARGKTLYDICSAVSNPEAVKDMFMNIELMNAIEKEGNKAKLVQKHQQIYASMWPDYSHASSLMARQERMKQALNEGRISNNKSSELVALEQALSKELNDIKLKYNDLKSEKPGFFSSSESVIIAKQKMNIMAGFLTNLSKATTVNEYCQKIEQFINSDEYTTLSEARKFGYQTMDWKATSGTLIDNLYDAAVQQVSRAPKLSNKPCI